MKTKLAALVLLTATAGSAFAHGGDVIAGVAVGTVLGSAIASQPRAAVTVQYGSPYPNVIYAPPPVAYAPPPPVVGYAPPPPVMVYPAPRVVYGTPYYGAPAHGHPGRGLGHHKHHHHGHGDDWGRGRW